MKKDKPVFIYLDQNKWIDLARAYHEHPKGEKYKTILHKLIIAIDDKKVILPLSVYNFIETQKIQNKARQKRLAETMVALSRGWGIALADDIITIEIQKAGAKLFGFSPSPSPSPMVFKQSLSFTWGINLGKVAESIDNPEATSADFIDSIDRLLITPQIVEMFLTGEILGESGLKNVINGYKNGLAIFTGLTKEFRSRPSSHAKSQLNHKRGYILDLATDLREIIDPVLNVYGKSINDIVAMGENKVVEFIESVPALDVEAEMVSRRNVSWNREIDKNDWADIRFLMVAIPYCNVVVTENYWKDFAQKSSLDKKYNTAVLSDLNKLEKYL